MPRYKWEGKTLRGEKKKGELEAPDEGSVRTHLRQQNVIPTKVVAKGKEVSFSFGRQKIKKKDVAVFTRQLATMIDAGLPLVQSMDILAMQHDNKAFKEIIKNIKEDVEGGSTFAGALKKHPKAFDELYVNLVVAGEEGGILDNVLTRLAIYIEKAEALKKKIQSALVYPSTIVAVAVIVVAVLMIFVIPVFEKMFTSVGHTLPLPTLIVIGISNLLKKYIFLIIVTLVILLFMLKRYYSTEKGKFNIDNLILKDYRGHPCDASRSRRAYRISGSKRHVRRDVTVHVHPYRGGFSVGRVDRHRIVSTIVKVQYCLTCRHTSSGPVGRSSSVLGYALPH